MRDPHWETRRERRGLVHAPPADAEAAPPGPAVPSLLTEAELRALEEELRNLQEEFRNREAELAARERRVAEREAALAAQRAPGGLDEEAAAKTRDAIQKTDEEAAACLDAASQSLDAALAATPAFSEARALLERPSFSPEGAVASDEETHADTPSSSAAELAPALAGKLHQCDVNWLG